MSGLALLTLIWACASAAPAPSAAAPIRLAAGGKALLPVVVPADATPRVRAAAENLAAYLRKITGAQFRPTAGGGPSGVAVGRAGDFPALGLADLWDAKDPTQSEDYLLRSHAGGLYVLGASDLAVEHAVWDLLHHVGYRQFFPGPTWEVIPNAPDLAVELDAKEHPAYYARRIWYGYGPWDYAAQPYAQWCARNRATSGIVLNTGHAYDGIISRNKAAFAAHPEYLGLLGGRRASSKLCISNPGLRKLVAADALAQFAKDPALQSVSVDPSDGGGWCECDACKAMGSISDRALTLANEVASAVEADSQRYPGRYVGMYAYSQHSPPPHIRVHPRVIISVATAFIRGGYTVDELLDGWHARGATLGIREYYAVHPWDRDLPGKARGANTQYLRTSIPHFHAKGVRFLSAESSDNWGPNGLGYYLSARILWDLREAGRVEALVADFLDRAFGAAREPMAEFYRLIDGANHPLLSDDLVGRMYRLLAEAQKRTADPATPEGHSVRARLADLVLYTRYVELWRAYAGARGPARQEAFEALIRHGYRMRKTMMIHAKALYRDVARRDKAVSIPPQADWQAPDPKNPWKASTPWTPAELEAIVSQGIRNNAVIGFKAAAFSRDLVPIDRLHLPEAPTLAEADRGRGQRVFHVWVAKAPADIELKVTGGLIAHYRDRGDVKIKLFEATGAEARRAEVSQARVPPDGIQRGVTLRAARTGLHVLTVDDGQDCTRVVWPAGMSPTVEASLASSSGHVGSRSAWFYVPRGTKVVGGYSSAAGGAVHDADGKQVLKLPAASYFQTPVAPGQDGRLWSLRGCSGDSALMTVPPYSAGRADGLLLPREIVDADAPAGNSKS